MRYRIAYSYYQTQDLTGYYRNPAGLAWMDSPPVWEGMVEVDWMSEVSAAVAIRCNTGDAPVTESDRGSRQDVEIDAVVGAALDAIWAEHNRDDRPRGREIRSMSVGDVIEIRHIVRGNPSTPTRTFYSRWECGHATVDRGCGHAPPADASRRGQEYGTHRGRSRVIWMGFFLVSPVGFTPLALVPRSLIQGDKPEDAR